ncbi:Hypothetical protein NCS54_01389100 [Fusarium falciforme]|uniref:Hypothetical protein n=1 Tax=Fusarium falciforme TaxID=195108 RepID=UPI0023014C4A|nr:Hypothetical protein NCS54_01389100 [Fusarium falciforme]WAO96224.1 Hypothetical protein NCS54_01389100 [Fusarium falciforme]
MALTIAIVGGGIGGLTAAIALRQHPGIQVQVYERASEFQEVGALIGLAPNGLRTLEKLGVQGVLEDELGWRNPTGTPTFTKHWRAGDVVSNNAYERVPDRRHHFSRMHRALLQKELLKKLPEDILHPGKDVTEVQVSEDDVTVFFKDKTSTTVDLVIGADGIRSQVRKTLVPQYKLMGWGDAMFRATFPYELVQDIEGLDQDSTRWQSPTSWFFASRLGTKGYGVTFNFNANTKELDDLKKPLEDVVWNSPASVDDVRDAFKVRLPSPSNLQHPTQSRESPNNHILPGISPSCPRNHQPDTTRTLRRYTNAFGPKLDTWTFADRVVLIGDAAHAHGGAFGAGASLAIDDAYTLYLALRAVFPQALPISRPIRRSHIGLALDLYESVRRPHAARVLDIVLQDRQKQFARNEGLKAAGKEESDQDFRERMKGRKGAAWLHEHDVEKAFQEAITRRFSSGEQNGHGNP